MISNIWGITYIIFFYFKNYLGERILFQCEFEGFIIFVFKIQTQFRKVVYKQNSQEGLFAGCFSIFYFPLFDNDYKNITCKMGATFVNIIQKLRKEKLHRWRVLLFMFVTSLIVQFTFRPHQILTFFPCIWWNNHAFAETLWLNIQRK